MSQRARNALKLMVDIADNASAGAPVVLKDVARRQHVSKRYLEQLATMLRNARLLNATSGRRGGYRLPRPASQIQVGQVVEAISGELNVVECVQNKDICPRAELCPSRRVWTRLNTVMREVLDEYTVSDLSEVGLDHLFPCTTDRWDHGEPCLGTRPPPIVSPSSKGE